MSTSAADPQQPQPGSPPVTSPYPPLANGTWVPVYTGEEVRSHVRRWTAAAWWLAGGTIALMVVLIAVLADAGHRSDPVGVLAVGGAVVGGLLLVAIGIGMLHGEALRAEAVEYQSTPDGGLAPTGGIGTVVQGLREGLGGLTAARALVFAGAALLSVAAISGAVGMADADEPADEPSSTRTPEPGRTEGAVEPDEPATGG